MRTETRTIQMINLPFYFSFILFLIVTPSQGQITLNNSSFEGEPQDAVVPMGWQGCELGSTPDILPGSWGVYNEPSDGETFMGLITRQDGSWESVGQKLSKPIKKGVCYRFGLDLSHSKTYANYNKPVKIKIWGGNGSCSKNVLLGESKAISHTAWKRYSFRIEPNQDIQYIIIEARSIDGIYFSYNGNILLDNISVLRPCHRAENVILDNKEKEKVMGVL